MCSWTARWLQPLPPEEPRPTSTRTQAFGVIDHGAGQSHLSLFRYNEFGELTAQGTPITVGVPNANGVAILSADDRDRI